MGNAKRIPPPIPGDLEVHDLGDPIRALAMFYRAFNDRDLTSMERVWEHSPDVIVISPLVGITRGWPAMRAAYERGFAAPTKLTTEFYDYTVHRFGDIAYAIGRERGESTSEAGTVHLVAQATNIVHRADGTWRMIHHHVSVPGPPPAQVESS
jgi:ketosteroid isomerase-like protein